MSASSKILGMLCAAASIVSCGRKDIDNRPVLAVSLEPQRFMLEQIVGDNFRVVSLMPNGENPETYEPSPVKRMDVENSKAYFMTGYLPFESNLRLTAKDTSIFVNTSADIIPIYGTHGHSHSHSEFLPSGVEEQLDADPHVWTSVRNARLMLAAMAEKVIAVDPENSNEYKSRYEAFDAHLDSLDKAFAQRLADKRGKSFLVWHPSLSYFARDYGLNQMSVGHETKESSVNHLRSIIDEAKNDSVEVFFYQKDFDSRQAQTISSSVGARLVPVNPGSYDWEEELVNVVNELDK